MIGPGGGHSTLGPRRIPLKRKETWGHSVKVTVDGRAFLRSSLHALIFPTLLREHCLDALFSCVLVSFGAARSRSPARYAILVAFYIFMSAAGALRSSCDPWAEVSLSRNSHVHPTVIALLSVLLNFEQSRSGSISFLSLVSDPPVLWAAGLLVERSTAPSHIGRHRDLEALCPPCVCASACALEP